MPTRLRCPSCESQMQVRDELLGKKVRCPKCKGLIETTKPPEELVAEVVEEEAEVEAIVEEPRRQPRRDEDEDDRPRRSRRDEEEDYDDRPRRRSRRDEDDDDRLRRRSWRDDDHELRQRERIPMPVSVIVATSVVGILALIQFGLLLLAFLVFRDSIVNLGKPFYGLYGSSVVSVLILVGMIVRQRMAWQWGMIFGCLLGLLYGGITAITFTIKGSQLETIVSFGFLFMSACFFTIFACMLTESAKVYFNLDCPRCGRITMAADDFFFMKARCKRCRISF